VVADVELERLEMAWPNIVTDEVRANGIGGIDMARFDRAVQQIALTYELPGRSADGGRTSSMRPSCRLEERPMLRRT
jgi:hypothetical protein